ncbi:MAG: AAA family ATPase [Candidatus Doudnabacteria bacterium]|nr:AAA family ATPase [Candidatus Doudnabacteria bacterium]
MYLKRLEIHGFKSFAQKTTMEFSKGIISIVGPNGSGKSNVADALRWVLGEQSPKIIRGKKADDVIFAGSDKKGRQGLAEVVATFDNADRRIPVDSSEVAIGRRIDRSGESEYLLNGNKVRLLDIIDLVLKSNIGTSRYTVIGQGTIDQMVLAGPGEVKNLLDEASGVKTYYIKREKTLKRLEQTAQNLMRAEDLMAEIEPRLKSLRRQAKKMEARSEIEQELKIYQREFFGKTFWQLKVSLDEILKQLEEVGSKKHELEEQSGALRREVESLEAGGQNGSREFNHIQEELNKLLSQKNKLLEDLSLVRGKMQSQKTAVAGDASTLQVEVHSKQRKIEEINAKIEATSKEKEILEQNFVGQFKILEDVNKKLNELSQKLSNPAQIDWAFVDRELKALETVWTQFYGQLQHGGDLEQLKQKGQLVAENFEKFKLATKSAVIDPHLGLLAVKQELDNLLKEKEDLSGKVNAAQLDMGKSKISLDFLERELTAAKQEKLHLDLELKKAQSSSPDEFWQDLLAEEDRIKKLVEALGQEVLKTETILKNQYQKEDDRQKNLRKLEGQYRDFQDGLSKVKDRESAISIEKAKYDTQMEVLAEEVRRILGPAELEVMGQQAPTDSTPDLEAKIMRLKNQLETIGGMDELTLKEYQETESRFTNLSTQVADLKQGMNDLRQIIDELDTHIKQKFGEAFHKINEKFEFYFRVLFNGGRAYLSILKTDEEEKQAAEAMTEEERVDASEELAGLRPEEKVVQKYEKGPSNIVGIDIKATPPGKKLASIQALSGGERAMTSIALLCSLLACFPSPFVVLDEVDAALDDANTIRFGQILGTLAHQTQFVTITHNRETMAQANILYGVTMGDDGVSKLLSVKLDQAKAFAK